MRIGRLSVEFCPSATGRPIPPTTTRQGDFLLTGHLLGGMDCRAETSVGEELPMDERFWPWPIAKSVAEWSEFDRDYLNLMQAAYIEGYSPRVGRCDSIELGPATNGRSACLVRRGKRNGWEPFLGDLGRSVRLGPSYSLPLGECACVCIRPPFHAVAYFAMEWMRGRPLESLLADFEFVGGYPAGIILRPDVASEWTSSRSAG